MTALPPPVPVVVAFVYPFSRSKCPVRTVQTPVETVGRFTIDKSDPHGSLGAAGAGDGEAEGNGEAAITATAAKSIAIAYHLRRRGWIVRSDDPIGGYRCGRRSSMLGSVAIEVGVVLLTIVCFVVLELYVAGCERV
jgi:hypothetical protein